MLKFDNISFKYESDDYEMIRNLSFSVNDGEFISIIGASGCGKSTIFRLINGLEKPDNGKIFIDERPIEQQKNYSSYMPQRDLLFPWRTIEKNICIPMEIQNKNKKEMHEKATAMLDEVGLLSYKNKYPRDLSGGMRQRASFARTLLAGAGLLLLDEPAAGMNPNETQELMDTIRFVQEHFDMTTLLIEHDMKLVGGICEELTVLNFGQVLAQGETSKVLKDPTVITAYLGE